MQLLFKAKCRPFNGEGTAEPTWQAFAYVRCFEGAGEKEGDKLADAGCVRIKPDYFRNKEWYEVVPLDQILAREFATEVPQEPNVFHVSYFLPN